MRTYETYEHLCTVNRYLYGEMEQCTVMIKHLESCGVDASHWKLKRSRLKYSVSINLESFEIAIGVAEAARDKDKKI